MKDNLIKTRIETKKLKQYDKVLKKLGQTRSENIRSYIDGLIKLSTRK